MTMTLVSILERPSRSTMSMDKITTMTATTKKKKMIFNKMLFCLVFVLVAITPSTTALRPDRTSKYMKSKQSQGVYDNGDQKHITISSNDDEASADGQSALLHYQAQNTDGYYKFGYANPDGQYRVEEGSPDEGILGSYGYVSTDGRDIKVYYSAGVQGFRIITAAAYKILLRRRAKKLLDIPGELLTPDMEVEPYEPDAGAESESIYRPKPDIAGKPFPEVPEIHPPISRSTPFGFVSYRTAGRQPGSSLLIQSPLSLSSLTTTTTTTTTSEAPPTETTTPTTTKPTTVATTTTTTSPTTTSRMPELNGAVDQSTSPIFPGMYNPYLGYNGAPVGGFPWRLNPQQIGMMPPIQFNQQMSSPFWNQTPFPVYYHPQFGMQSLPDASSQGPQFAPRPNVQPPIIIRV